MFCDSRNCEFLTIEQETPKKEPAQKLNFPMIPRVRFSLLYMNLLMRILRGFSHGSRFPQSFFLEGLGFGRAEAWSDVWLLHHARLPRLGFLFQGSIPFLLPVLSFWWVSDITLLALFGVSIPWG